MTDKKFDLEYNNGQDLKFEKFEINAEIYRDNAGYLNLDNWEVPQNILPELKKFHHVCVKLTIEPQW